jgi:KDO2-lipid IV(A) lauroyltransferase
MGAKWGIALLTVLGRLPLPWLRGLGWGLGWVLYALAGSRRHVVHTNLKLCFPQATVAQRRRWAVQNFIYFAQTLLDRGWLWSAPAEVVERRLKRVGAWPELTRLAEVNAAGEPGLTPTILFSPHFYGLEAGGMAMSLAIPRDYTSIFTTQSSSAINDWMTQGRQRFGQVRMLRRDQGVKAIVQSLRQGGALYLLPDMNFGPEESIFVPFYGVSAATVPSLSRFAKLGRARVVPVVSRVTRTGYEIEVMPPWENFPTEDVQADTALMNRLLEGWINPDPAQYYWVHKRFKTRPAGQPSVY